MPNIKKSTKPLASPDDRLSIKYVREEFNEEAPDWNRQMELCDAHAMELRGMKADLFIDQYNRIQREGRLVLIMARDMSRNDLLIGYSSHFWYRHLHFNMRIANDDAWYVVPEYRNRGIGRALREMALVYLKAAGCVGAYGRTKTEFPHDESMTDLGYDPFEMVWLKDLTQ